MEVCEQADTIAWTTRCQPETAKSKPVCSFPPNPPRTGPQTNSRRAPSLDAATCGTYNPSGNRYTKNTGAKRLNLALAFRDCQMATQCYAIVLPGQTSDFRVGFRPDSNRGKFKICPPADRRPAGGPILRPPQVKSCQEPCPETRFPNRTHFCIT